MMQQALESTVFLGALRPCGPPLVLGAAAPRNAPGAQRWSGYDKQQEWIERSPACIERVHRAIDPDPRPAARAREVPGGLYTVESLAFGVAALDRLQRAPAPEARPGRVARPNSFCE